MAFLKLKISKQQNEKFQSDTLKIEDDTVIIAPIVSFYKSGSISYWVLNPQGLTFTENGDNFSSLKLRKDNTTADLSLQVNYTVNDTDKTDGRITVDKMEFVSEIPHDLRLKLN